MNMFVVLKLARLTYGVSNVQNVGLGLSTTQTIPLDLHNASASSKVALSSEALMYMHLPWMLYQFVSLGQVLLSSWQSARAVSLEPHLESFQPPIWTWSKESSYVRRKNAYNLLTIFLTVYQSKYTVFSCTMTVIWLIYGCPIWIFNRLLITYITKACMKRECDV